MTPTNGEKARYESRGGRLTILGFVPADGPVAHRDGLVVFG